MVSEFHHHHHCFDTHTGFILFVMHIFVDIDSKESNLLWRKRRKKFHLTVSWREKKTISLSDLMSGTLVKHIKILFIIIIICGSLFSTSIFFNTTQEKIVTAKLSQLVLDIQKILSRVWTADQHQFTSSLFIKYWLSLAKCRENIFYTFIFADSTWFYFKNSQHLLIWLLLTFYEAHFELLNKPMQCNVMLVQSVSSSSSSKEVNNIQRLFKLTNCSSIYSRVLKPDAYVCVENEMKEEDMFNITQYS